jgi:hypothetical protein
VVAVLSRSTLLLQEAIEDLRAELLLRAWERRQALEALVDGRAAGPARVVDLALPSRLAAAVARLNGRHVLPLLPGQGQATRTAPPTASQLTGPKPATDADAGADADPMARIRALRNQDPPLAWSAIVTALGLSEDALRKMRLEHGL